MQPSPNRDAVTYSHTRQHLAEIMDRVNDDHAPVLIARQNGRAGSTTSTGWSIPIKTIAWSSPSAYQC